MTVSENVNADQGSTPDLNYVPLETNQNSEDRASSVESTQNNNSKNQNLNDAVEENDPLAAETAQLMLTVLTKAVPRQQRLSKGAHGEETKPDIPDPEIGQSGNDREPPDGGLRACTIIAASFIINGVLMSVLNCYSMVYKELQKRLDERDGDGSASVKASLVGSLAMGSMFFLSPIAGILTDKIGIRMTTFIGGAIASGGMLLSSFVSEKVEALYFTYSIMYGLGASLAYTPSLVILGHYFKRYLGLVNGVVTAGSSVFTVLMPFLIESLLDRFKFEGMLRVFALLTAFIMPCAFLFKPLNQKVKVERQRKSLRSKIKAAINVSIWKRKRYIVWAGAIPIALTGYFVPYVHIGKFVQVKFENGAEKWPIICIGITSGIGRLVFGCIADLPRVNRIFLQQISFIGIGLMTIFLPLTKHFSVLLTICSFMGLFDGCFISLIGPIAFDICGKKDATQAIGFLLGMISIPLTAGPPIAGWMYDAQHSYDLAFMLAGIPPIIGAAAMFLTRCVKDDSFEDPPTDPSQQRLTQSGWQNEEKELQDMSRNGTAEKS